MKKLLKNQKGQGIMEYVIISALVGICCIGAMTQFGDAINKRIAEMKSKVSQESLKLGR